MSYLKLTLLLLLTISLSCNKKSKQQEEQESEIAPTVSTEVVQIADNAHNSQNALDWEGVYQGVLPCADCEGLKTSITLLGGNKYRATTEYVGKSEKQAHESGNFAWDETGSIIVIGDGENQQKYKVGENVLFHLDKDGNQITGDLADKYKLMKNYSDFNLENKKWVLTKLMGQDIEDSKDAKIIFVMFNAKEAVVSGNNGCNLFSGGYTIESGNRIKIGNMMNTMMACDNMDQVTQFMGVLQKADNYTVVDGVLNLNKARMAPLASFKLAEAN